MMLIETTQEELGQLQQDFEIKRENIKKHHVKVQSGRQDKKMLKIYFEGFCKQIHWEKEIRERSQKLQVALGCKRSKNALKKWKMRVERTKKMREFFRRGVFIKKSQNLRDTFLAWKHQY